MQRSSRSHATLLVALLVLVAAGLLPGTAVRAGSPSDDAVASRAPLESLIPPEAASSILEKVAASRQQIAGGDTDEAMKTLDSLSKLMEKFLTVDDVRAARLHLGIRATLRDAEQEDDNALRVQIEHLLEQLGPAAKGEHAWLGRQQLLEAKQLLEKGDRAGAIEKLRAADPEPQLPEDEVPLDVAYEHVLTAIDALESGSPQDADAELAALAREVRSRPGDAGAASP